MGELPPPLAGPRVTPEVEGLTVHRVRMPLLRAHLAAHGSSHVRDLTIVQVRRSDGAVGWGECSALDGYPTSEDASPQNCWDHLTRTAGPALVHGGSESAIPRTGPPMARSALEAACLDARLKHEGVSLAVSIGAKRRLVETAAVVSAESTDELVAGVGHRVDAGHRWVSVKVVGSGGLGPALEVRREFPEINLCIDANGTLDLDETDWAQLDALELAHVEQPLAPGRDAELRTLATRIGTPICVDESLLGPADVERLAGIGGVAVFNVKPSRVGGLAAALEVVDGARRAGIEVFCGGLLESGIGRAHALAFAAVAADRPTHLGPSSSYFSVDVTEPIEFVGGVALGVPVGPGIGVAVLDDVLARYRVDRVDLHS
jgi:O-succinylbenzoate synthase